MGLLRQPLWKLALGVIPSGFKEVRNQPLNGVIGFPPRFGLSYPVMDVEDTHETQGVALVGAKGADFFVLLDIGFNRGIRNNDAGRWDFVFDDVHVDRFFSSHFSSPKSVIFEPNTL